MDTEFDARWGMLANEVLSGMKEWRLAHPKSTLAEIEATLDERMARLRAQMLEDSARASSSTDIAAVASAERPMCDACGGHLVARGRRQRRVTTDHNQQIHLERSYAVCTTCGVGVFPP